MYVHVATPIALFLFPVFTSSWYRVYVLTLSAGVYVRTVVSNPIYFLGDLTRTLKLRQPCRSVDEVPSDVAGNHWIGLGDNIR